MKIDKEIQELRKQNNVTNSSADKKRESFTYGMQPNLKLKTLELDNKYGEADTGNGNSNEVSITKKSGIMK